MVRTQSATSQERKAVTMLFHHEIMNLQHTSAILAPAPRTERNRSQRMRAAGKVAAKHLWTLSKIRSTRS